MASEAALGASHTAHWSSRCQGDDQRAKARVAVSPGQGPVRPRGCDHRCWCVSRRFDDGDYAGLLDRVSQHDLFLLDGALYHGYANILDDLRPGDSLPQAFEAQVGSGAATSRVQSRAGPGADRFGTLTATTNALMLTFR